MVQLVHVRFVVNDKFNVSLVCVLKPVIKYTTIVVGVYTHDLFYTTNHTSRIWVTQCVNLGLVMSNNNINT